MNMMLGMKNMGDTYQKSLETIDEEDLEVLKDSLCNPRMK